MIYDLILMLSCFFARPASTGGGPASTTGSTPSVAWRLWKTDKAIAILVFWQSRIKSASASASLQFYSFAFVFYSCIVIMTLCM